MRISPTPGITAAPIRCRGLRATGDIGLRLRLILVMIDAD